jgi:DNA replication protein DnaC
LSIALGVKAVQQGFSVGFYRIEDLLHAMKRDADVPPQRLKGTKYLKVALLIIDEVGFQALTRQEAGLFFRLVSYRYQKGSTVITTNLDYTEWANFLGNKALVDALLSRLRHQCHTVTIDGPSLREPTG